MSGVERDPALQDLSRDHQRFLLHIRNIRWLLEGDERADPQPEVLANFMRFWSDHGLPHLREEEDVIFPVYEKIAADGAQEVEELLADHDWLRYTIAKLAAATVDDYNPIIPGLLGQLADRLEEHVRFEERTLFERVQDGLSPAQLTALGEQSRRFRKEWRGGEGEIGMEMRPPQYDDDEEAEVDDLAEDTGDNLDEDL